MAFRIIVSFLLLLLLTLFKWIYGRTKWTGHSHGCFPSSLPADWLLHRERTMNGADSRSGNSHIPHFYQAPQPLPLPQPPTTTISYLCRFTSGIISLPFHNNLTEPRSNIHILIAHSVQTKYAFARIGIFYLFRIVKYKFKESCCSFGGPRRRRLWILYGTIFCNISNPKFMSVHFTINFFWFFSSAPPPPRSLLIMFSIIF